MTKLFCALLLILAQSSYAEAGMSRTLQDISNFYDKLAEADLIEKHYWVDFTVGKEATAKKNSSPVCRQSTSYSTFSIDDVIFHVKRHTDVAIELGFYGTPQESIISRIQAQMMERLTQALENKKIQMCIDYTTPPYSDGHEQYYVLVNGRIQFVFEVGFPD